MPPTHRKSRLTYSCTQCARRKVRCSKTIPCSSCMDRGLASECHIHSRDGLLNTGHARGSEDCTSSLHEAVPSETRSAPRPTSSHECDAAHRAYSPLTLVQDQTRQYSPVGSRPTPSSRRDTARLFCPSADSSINSAMFPSHGETITPTSAAVGTCSLTNESAVTLEFLALGRRNILGSGRRTASFTPPFIPDMADNLVTGSLTAFPDHWDAILSHEEARQVLEFHEESFVWYHNVVHLPAFRQEFESNLTKAAPDLNWIALYYAILCVSRSKTSEKTQLTKEIQTTFHHFCETDFQGLGISIIGCVCLRKLELSNYADILQTDVNSLDHYSTEVSRA